MVRALFRKSISLIPWRVRNTIKNLPLIAPLQRSVLERFLEGREFVHTVDAGPARGLKYPVVLPEDKGVWTGTYELEFASALAEAVQPGDVCLDIGGWRGFYGGVMALAGAKRVFIFEPLPANCERVRKLIALNPELPLTLLEAAVGEQAGEAEFCVMPASSMGKLKASQFQQLEPAEQRIVVKVVSLDELLTEGKIKAPAVIKIDVEGAETFVLRGAKRLLTEHEPKLFIEVHSDALGRSCREFLAQFNYDVRTLDSDEREISHIVATKRPKF
jgi:FkbM family methyltransferase